MRYHIIRTACLLFLLLALASRLDAQNRDVRLVLRFRNATLEEIVRTLEKSTGFTFVYGEEVRLSRPVTMDARGLTIDEVLQQAFRDEPVEYEFSGRYILLKNRPRPARKPTGRRFTISGHVSDLASSETLPGGNVYERRRSAGTTTNAFGFYSLTLPEGPSLLSFSYMGYTTRETAFDLRRDTVINVALESGGQMLEEVVVDGTRHEAGVQSTMAGSHELPMEQVRHTPTLLGEADVVKTLQLMPGVQGGTEGFSGLYVRGGSADQNLVMLDGTPVYNADHLLGLFSIFTPEAVKKVTLFKSAFPARYGGRISSIVDVRTNDGDMQRYHGAVGVGASACKLHFEGPLVKGRTSFSISARGLPTVFLGKGIKDAWHTSYGNTEYTDNGYNNYYFYDLNAKLNHKFSDRSRLYLGFYMGRDLYRYDTYEETRYTNEDTRYTYETKNRLLWGNTIASARWNQVLTNRLFANATLAFNSYRMEMRTSSEDSNYKGAEQRNLYGYGTRYRSGIRDWSFRLDFDYRPLPSHRVKFGGEFLHHTFRPETSTVSTKDVDAGVQQEDTLYYGYYQKPLHGCELALYVEDDFDISERLSLNAGIHLSLFATQGRSYWEPQPRLSARYRLDGGWSLKVAYSHMAQYVHLLTSTPLALPTDLWVPVTRRVRPMRANHFSVGGYYTGLAGWEFSAEAYYKQMRNVLEYRDGVSLFGASTNWEDRVEMGRARSVGLELMAQRTVGRTTGWLSYTLSKTDRRFKGGNISRGEWFPYRYDRRHSVTLCMNHKLSSRINLSGSWVFYTGGAITVPTRQTIVLRPDGTYDKQLYVSQRNNFRLPATHRLNVGIDFNKKTKHGMRTWNISVYNLYNAMNPNFVYAESAYNTDGQVADNYAERLQVRVKKMTLLPCIPSVSYTYRF